MYCVRAVKGAERISLILGECQEGDVGDSRRSKSFWE
jgi:hypothetical protein